jgi:F-type H+-transporting ATPase subunit delta
MRGIRISSRYAKSLLLLSVERNEADRVYEDMKVVHRAVSGNRDLKVFLKSPVIKADKKNAALEKVFGASLSATTMAFITLLANKGRESMLPEVAESFIAQMKVHKHITPAVVTSAAPLDGSVRDTIIRKVAALAPGTIELEEKINADLIGGFVLKVGDHQIDTSVLTKLRNLRRDFSENPYIPEI